MRAKDKLILLVRRLISGDRKMETTKNIAGVLYRKIVHDKNRPSAEPYRKDLVKFLNAHSGERCFIIGNGPSLNKTDLALLRDEYTIGVNGIFYKYDDILFTPTYYVVEDNHVIFDNLVKINEIDYATKLFPVQYADVVEANDDTYFFDFDADFYDDLTPHFEKPRFSKDISEVVYAGQTVTYVNLQLAFYLGFTEVYLVGVDFSYHIPDSAKIDGKTITSQEDDPNHFHPDYFGKGKKWHDPKLENCLNSYRFAKAVFEEEGRKVYNATIGGKLEVFKRVNYYSLFNKKPFLKRPNDPIQYTVSRCIEGLTLNDPSRGPVVIELGRTVGVGDTAALLTRFVNESKPKGTLYVVGSGRDKLKRLLKEEYRLDLKGVKFVKADGPKQSSSLSEIFKDEETFDLALVGPDGESEIESMEALVERATPSSTIIATTTGDPKQPEATDDLIGVISSLVGGKKDLQVWLNRSIVVASGRLSLPMMDRLSTDSIEACGDTADVTIDKMKRIVGRGRKKHRLHSVPFSSGSLADSRGVSLVRRLMGAGVPFLIAKGQLYVYY